jgi:hypothetical protein
MGGDASKCGGLKIVLEKYVFKSGEVIQGTINFVINSKFPPCTMILGFKGLEYVSWYETRTERNRGFGARGSRMVRVHISNRQVISRTKYSIMSWSSDIHPGSYAIPFTFVLPADIPSSFKFFENDVVLTIIYKVYARLVSGRTKIGDKQEVNIWNYYDIPRAPDKPVTAKLISWCCSSKGHVTLSVFWQNDKYSPGVPLNCILSIDNTNSIAYVMEVKARSYYIITALAQGRRRVFKKEVFRSNYPVQVRPGAKIVGQEGQNFLFDLKQSQKMFDVMNIHSIKGHIIQCSFYIEFELVFDVGCLCCGDSPSLVTEFFVRPNLRIEAPVFAAPQQWNPYMFHPVNVSYQPSYEINDKGQTELSMMNGFNNSVTNITQ